MITYENNNKIAVFFSNSIIGLYKFRLDLMREMQANGYHVIACTPIENMQLKPFFINQDIELKEIKLNRGGINVLEDMKMFLSIYTLLKKTKPNLVINYTIKPAIYGSLAASFAGVKNIYSMITGLGYVFIANSVKVRILRKIVKIFYRISLKCNNKVFFLNRDDIGIFLMHKTIKSSQALLINVSFY
jgi:UDP-N-acetylglucosamine:LPS N-acetylglucosamine transferase